uniref:Saposin B-type domain-containing protein n=1 Tax=Panagrolaimus sp. ES5 TaxID=591445 RepID=A0AC34G1V2_9BILA
MHDVRLGLYDGPKKKPTTTPEITCTMCKYVVSDIQSANTQRTLVDQTWIDKCKIFCSLEKNCTDLLKKHYNDIAVRHLSTNAQTVCHKFGYCTDSGPTTVSTRLQKVIGDLKTGEAPIGE